MLPLVLALLYLLSIPFHLYAAALLHQLPSNLGVKNMLVFKTFNPLST